MKRHPSENVHAIEDEEEVLETLEADPPTEEFRLDRSTLIGEDEHTMAENIAMRAEQIDHHLRDMRDRAAYNSRQSQHRQQQYYNATVTQRPPFQPGDLVWKIIHNRGSAPTSRNKFGEVYEGPYIIVHRNRNGTYVIKDPTGNTDTVHSDSLVKAKIREDMIPEVTSSARPLAKGLARYRKPE
jgi:hypothetical protein